MLEKLAEVKPFLLRKWKDYEKILRYPNIKHYLFKDLYFAYCDMYPKYKFIVGIDPDMNENFDLQNHTYENLLRENTLFCSALFKKENLNNLQFDENLIHGFED